MANVAAVLEPTGTLFGASILGTLGPHTWLSRMALDANNLALCAHYEKEAFVRTDFAERNCLTLGDQFCVVDLAWTITRKDQSPQQFNTAYSLAKRDGHWKVAAVTAYEERRPGTQA